MQEMEQSAKPLKNPKVLSRAQKRLIFYICVVALPVLQYCVFFIYTHLDSIAMSFREYGNPLDGGKVTYTFNNFKTAGKVLVDKFYMIKNSLVLYCLHTFVGFSLATIFSYYIFKKFPLSGMFKVALFLPQIISSLIFAILFQGIVNNVYSAIMIGLKGTKEIGLLRNEKTCLAVVFFYNVWISFGIRVLMFSNAMSAIDGSIMESANLDGANIVQEFFHIVIPMIYSTLSAFLVLGIANLMRDQMGLYNLFGKEVPFENIQSFGYFLYMQSQKSDVYLNASRRKNTLTFPEISAVGTILTLIVLPLTLLFRKALEKLGPEF